MTWDVIVGDCRDVMAGMAAASVDAIVTDPPYELGFMGKAWDRSGVAFDAATWAAALRVLKPGGHLLAFGGSRTFHRIAVAIEDAGFEIRDTISWLYGSGFPKSHNLDGDWDGWGTALKPAWEPVIVARKPLVGTVAANVAAHGTGAINIDACRVEAGGNNVNDQESGRWPANVILDEEAGAMLDAQSGERGGGFGIRGKSPNGRFYANGKGIANTFTQTGQTVGFGDTGGASRFFYCAKASRGERNAGLEGMPERDKHIYSGGIVSADHPGTADGGGARASLNHHPTVKPIALMRYLVRLVTPPGGVVLDPFTGSGTTGCAVALEGFGFVGVEMSPEYAEIARRRIAHWGRQLPLEVPR